jgi:opacity protein-like surface antigen
MLKKELFLATFLFLPLTSFANVIDAYLSGGATFSWLTNDKTVQISPFVTNKYDADNDLEVGPLGGIGIGFTRVFNPRVAGFFSLAGYYVNFDKVDGTEHPFVNAGSDFDTLSYQFRAESFALLAEGRLFYAALAWQPFILVGVGVSWNELYDYSEAPSGPGSTAESVPHVFGDHTEAAFAYEVGLGIQYNSGCGFACTDPTSAWKVSLDYRYMNMGKGQLGNFPGSTLNNSITISDLSTQALVLTVQTGIL